MAGHESGFNQACRDRFFVRLDVDSLDQSGCWLWTGYIDRDGYGRIWYAGRAFLTHRFAYLMLRGEIPHRAELHHVCKIKRCCNPWHMLALSNEEHKQIERDYRECVRRIRALHDPARAADEARRRETGSLIHRLRRLAHTRAGA